MNPKPMHKPTTVSAPLAVKRMGMYGTLPEDYFILMGRKENPVLNGATGKKTRPEDGTKIKGRPSYMQPTQTSRRKDLGMAYLKRPTARKVVLPTETESNNIKLYGPPVSLPSVQQETKRQVKQQSEVSERHGLIPGETVGKKIAKERQVTEKEMNQIRSTCRYVRRKGSCVDPPWNYKMGASRR